MKHAGCNIVKWKVDLCCKAIVLFKTGHIYTHVCTLLEETTFWDATCSLGNITINTYVDLKHEPRQFPQADLLTFLDIFQTVYICTTQQDILTDSLTQKPWLKVVPTDACQRQYITVCCSVLQKSII